MSTNKDSGEAGEKIKKPRGGKYSPVIGSNGYLQGIEDEEEKKAIIRSCLIEATRYMGAPIVKSDEEAIERIEEYFNHCINDGKRPTVEGLALCLGTTRSTMFKWETGESRTISGNIIKKAKEFIGNFDANMVAENKLNPVTYIFRSKNYYGMRDSQEYVLSPNVDAPDKKTILDQADLLPDPDK